jgi:exoribonuclease R
VQRRVRLSAPDETAIAASFAELREALEVRCEFPPEVLADAEASARSPRLPDLDRTSIPFVTIDPPDSQDLDQALHLERRGDGYRVHYAIADVSAFVTPGGPMDVEAHARGRTLYAPDEDALLYPAAISHGAASLLPDGTRPAVLWTFDLDAGGEAVAVDVVRALVRSRRKLSYEDAQEALDEEPFSLLREVGTLRQELEAARGGVDLQIPEQEVERGREGYELAFRTQLPVERWNAQISLLTGQEAARLMLEAKVGIVRTLPRADEHAVARLRRTAEALGVAWPESGSFADFVRSLDPAAPAHKAVLVESVVLLRGSGYEAFDGDEPENAKHAASAPRTRTRPPRCDGSSTGTSARSAWRSTPAQRSRTGCGRRCPACPRRWSSRPGARRSTRAGSSRQSRRPCSRRASARSSRRSSSRSTATARAASSS